MDIQGEHERQHSMIRLIGSLFLVVVWTNQLSPQKDVDEEKEVGENPPDAVREMEETIFMSHWDDIASGFLQNGFDDHVACDAKEPTVTGNR